MARSRTKWADWLVLTAMLGLGVVLATVPLALWVAWSPGVFLVVLASGGVASALLIALHDRSSSAARDRLVGRDAGPRPALPDRFVEEMHRLYPLVYHNRLTGTTRFHEAMERLRHLLR